MRKINTKLFVFLVVAVALFAGAVFGLHRLQAGNIAEALLWQAGQAEKDGKLDRAAKYLGRYLEFARDDLDTRAHLGMLLSDPQVAITPQRRARARFVIDQVLAKDPERHELRQRLCTTLIASRAFDTAKEHLSYLEKNLPNSGPIAALAGQWHEAQNRPAPAIDAYRRAIQLDAAQLDAYVRLVGLLKQADFGKEPRHGDEIERLVVASLEKAPHDAGILSLAAQHAQEKGNTKIALKYLEDGLHRNAAEPRLYHALARIHTEQGKRGEAIAKLRLGLEKCGKEHHHDLRWSLTNLLLDDNRLDDAKKLIQQMRETQPLSADYLDARILMQRGRWFDAAKQLERIRPALKGAKELAFHAEMFLGSCYEQLDEPMMQLAAYERATQLDPTSLTARRGLAGARGALGQTNEALQTYRELIDLTKDPHESAQRRLDYTRLLLQNSSAANGKEHRTIEQELDEIEKMLGKTLDTALLRAELLFVTGEKGKAQTVLQALVKEHPNRHEPWVALLALASPEEAATLMQTAEARFKDKADFRLAQIRYYGQHTGAASDDALKRLEDDLPRFEPRERSPLLQALAETHYFAGKYGDSGRVLARLIELPMHAQDVRIRMQQLELAILQEDDAAARKILGDIKRLEGDNGGTDWSFGEAMRVIHGARNGKKGDLDAARHLLTVAAAQRPNWHPIIQLRAELDDLQGRTDQAIANYRRAIDLGSRDPQALKQLLFLLSQAQRHEEVEQVLSRMQKQYGATDEVVRYYVAHSVNRRDFKKADYLIKQIVAANSSNYRDHLWMGQVLSLAGQAPDDAEKALRRAVALAPERPETRVALVRHLIGSGQHEKARAAIEATGTELPDDRKDGTLAQCYELAGFLGDAARSHQAALVRLPNSAAAHRAAADFYLRVNLLVDAETLYRKLLERQIPVGDDDAAIARRGLALALARQNRQAKTAEALRLVGLTLNDKGLLADAKFAEAPDERLLQAKVLGSLNHHRLRDQAITLLESLHAKNALSAEDQFHLARLNVLHGADAVHWVKARAILKTLVLEHPKNGRFLAFAAREHIQQKEYADAEALIVKLEAVERERKALAGGFGSLELRAKMFEQRGLGTQAATLLSEYARQPNAAPTRKLLLAHLHGRLGNFGEAIDLCEEVSQLAALKNEADAAAVALLRMNRPSEAMPTKFDQWQKQRQRVEVALRQALQKDAKDAAVRLHLADLMELQGKYAEVEKLCRDVLKENPEHLVALNNLAWLLGQKADSAQEAVTLVERAVAKYGPRPELLDTRAVAFLTLGHTAPAVRDLERVVNEAPTPTRLFHLCRAYERTKNLASAQAMLRQANERGLTTQHLHPIEQAEYQRVTAELSKRN